MARKETGDFDLEKALTGELWNDRAAEAVEGSCLSAFERAKGRRRAKAMMIWSGAKCFSDESRVVRWVLDIILCLRSVMTKARGMGSRSLRYKRLPLTTIYHVQLVKSTNPSTLTPRLGILPLRLKY